ncbi:MAG TPA: tetratricopeptide repeat protein [Methyloceanibacter sp.]|jgi:hypothetical protein|nr:tetratricopeptide repeat protein [Methyloceanibacter sp.]
MSDSEFFREVDEAVRHEQYKKLWDRYGLFAIIGAGLLVAGVAGYKGWTYWREKEAGDAGAQFTQALTFAKSGEAAKAREAFTQLAEKGPVGYRVLARFQLATAEAKAGETDKAIATYDALSNDAAVDNILKGYATIQAATLKLGGADYAEMERRLKALAEGTSPWRFSARELLGLSAYKLDNMPEAEKQFTALAGDESTPSNMRERADMMLALIAGAVKAPAATAN